MGKRGEAGTAAGMGATGVGSSSSGTTTAAASASETPRRWARAERERAGASPRARSAASNAGNRTWIHLRLSRFKLAGPPTPRDTEVSNASAIIHDSLGPVCICSLSGINSSMYYANAQQLSEEILDLVTRAQPPLRWFCIDASAVDDVDYSAAETLRALFALLEEQGI